MFTLGPLLFIHPRVYFRYVEPQGAGIRCDSGIREGSEISIYYDPLICKLVTHGKVCSAFCSSFWGLVLGL